MLKLKRKKQAVSGISKMKVYINSTKLGTLKNGEEKTFNYNTKKDDVLIIKYLWLKSVYDLSKIEENNYLNVSFSMNDLQFFIFGMIINTLTILYFIFKVKFIFYLTLASVSYFVYLLTIKKNRIIIEVD